jgi:hypothetical protein
MRPSYRTDGAFLLRLEAAILADTRQTKEWRQRVSGNVRQVALDLLGAEAEGPEKKARSVQK